MTEKECIHKLEVPDEADDVARLGFKVADFEQECRGVSGSYYCREKGCSLRSTVTLSLHKPSGQNVEEVPGAMDGTDYVIRHWRKIETSGSCLKEE